MVGKRSLIGFWKVSPSHAKCHAAPPRNCQPDIVLRGVGLPLFPCGLCGVCQYAWFEKLLTPLAKGCRRAGIRSPGFGCIESLVIGAPHVENALGHRL